MKYQLFQSRSPSPRFREIIKIVDNSVLLLTPSPILRFFTKMSDPCSQPINYMFKVNNRNTKRCEICSKLTTKTIEWRHWHRSGVFVVNYEHILHLVLVFLLNFENVNAYLLLHPFQSGTTEYANEK